MSQLVQERERHAILPARDSQVDRVALAHAVTAALTGRRRQPDRDGTEIGPQAVQRISGEKRASELRVERAAPREPDELGESKQPRLATSGHGRRVAASHGQQTLWPWTDVAGLSESPRRGDSTRLERAV